MKKQRTLAHSTRNTKNSKIIKLIKYEVQKLDPSWAIRSSMGSHYHFFPPWAFSPSWAFPLSWALDPSWAAPFLSVPFAWA